MADLMQVLRAFQQLPHIELDLTRRELDTRVLEQASQIVIHVRKHHVDRAPLISRRYIRHTVNSALQASHEDLRNSQASTTISHTFTTDG